MNLFLVRLIASSGLDCDEDDTPLVVGQDVIDLRIKRIGQLNRFTKSPRLDVP